MHNELSVLFARNYEYKTIQSKADIWPLTIYDDLYSYSATKKEKLQKNADNLDESNEEGAKNKLKFLRTWKG